MLSSQYSSFWATWTFFLLHSLLYVELVIHHRTNPPMRSYFCWEYILFGIYFCVSNVKLFKFLFSIRNIMLWKTIFKLYFMRGGIRYAFPFEWIGSFCQNHYSPARICSNFNQSKCMLSASKLLMNDVCIIRTNVNFDTERVIQKVMLLFVKKNSGV
jgi:hypothetical protein